MEKLERERAERRKCALHQEVLCIKQEGLAVHGAARARKTVDRRVLRATVWCFRVLVLVSGLRSCDRRPHRRLNCGIQHLGSPALQFGQLLIFLLDEAFQVCNVRLLAYHFVLRFLLLLADLLDHLRGLWRGCQLGRRSSHLRLGRLFR